MQQPSDPLVAVMVQRLDRNLREAFEERAAIVEFDAGLPRAHAECLALLGVLRGHPAVLSGLCVLQFHRDGAVHHLITTEPALARKHLADTGAVQTAVLDAADFVAGHCRVDGVNQHGRSNDKHLGRLTGMIVVG